LLHQLGYKLNLFGFDASMYYYGEDTGLPSVHPHFIKYNVPVVESVSDSADNIFVYPEMMVSALSEIKEQLPSSKHILWWLSVDNANMTQEMERIISNDSGLIHFVQSYYALDYVKNSLNITDDRLFYLSDYLNSVYLNMDCEEKNSRDDTVLFNPRKGYERTSRLIKHSDHRVKWQALSGMAPEEIPGVLQKAKVYIDFGNHPGKDRFPREAVSCGLRIITGRKGAAANDKDIPIPDELKVSDECEDAKILDMIYGLVVNYEKTGELYSSYKRSIDEEFHIFERDVLNTFSLIMHKSIKWINQDESLLRETIVDLVTREDYKTAFYANTVYRMKGYAEDEVMTILEGYIRIGLGEEQEALYLMNRLLNLNESSYEAYLIKAQALMALNMKEASDSLNSAEEYSVGTEDEEYVRQTVNRLREGLK